MGSMKFSTKLSCTVIVLSGIVFHVVCRESQKQCFDVESKTTCYFLPNVSAVNWDTAWKICKELDATLPVILNEKGQKVFTEYLRKHFSRQSVWTAGRYVGSSSDWRWLNGQDFRDTEKLSCQRRGGSCALHFTQAVLTKQLIYEARFANYSYAFICSFPAVHCTNKSQKSISWKDGCLEWNTSYELRLNEARNECLKGGGDLATFSEPGDLDRLSKNFTVAKGADKGFLIGLHRKWWIWNETDVHDIKYNLLDDYGNLGNDCLFINESSKWRRDKCSANKYVICQKVVDAREPSSTNEPVTASVAIGIAIAVVLIVAIIVVIILIFIKKRWRVSGTKSGAGTLVSSSSNPATPSHYAIVERPDDIYATIDDDMDAINEANGRSPSIFYTKEECCDKPLSVKPVSVYSQPADFDESGSNRFDAAVYSEPYSSSVQTSAQINPF